MSTGGSSARREKTPLERGKPLGEQLSKYGSWETWERSVLWLGLLDIIEKFEGGCIKVCIDSSVTE